MLDPALLAPERIRPLLRREYDVLVEAGVFDGERVELLRGVLVEMSPQGEPHSRVTAWLHRMLVHVLPVSTYDVRSHSPFAASEDSEPEPDVSVSHPGPDGPTPQNTLLLVEVAGSSLRKDRVIKTEIYAAAGVPEYWIVDLRTSTVEILTEPGAHGYANSVRVATGELRPHRLPGVTVDVEAIPWTFKK